MELEITIGSEKNSFQENIKLLRGIMHLCNIYFSRDDKQNVGQVLFP